jgi:hypothetical protein
MREIGGCLSFRGHRRAWGVGVPEESDFDKCPCADACPQIQDIKFKEGLKKKSRENPAFKTLTRHPFSKTKIRSLKKERAVGAGFEPARSG